MDKEIEVMRIFRLPPMGKLVVEANGHRFEKLADVTHPALNQRLMAAIGELIVFADGYQKLVDAGLAPPVSVESSPETDSAEIEAKRAAFLASLERERDYLLAKTSMIPDPELVISAAAKDDPPRLEPTISIVEQIDAILQKHIQAEPSFKDRSIHLEQSPGGGLHINVDGEVYQRPTEIKEKDVQMVIKMALKEWEAT